MKTPLFEEYTLATMERAKSTFCGRGVEYGDTWAECRFLKMAAVAKELGLNIPTEHFRALATAAFCDMKYWRNLGGYKDDSIIDGMNYDGFLAEEMRRAKVAATSKQTCMPDADAAEVLRQIAAEGINRRLEAAL
jgi:hypothetical protein